jgi:hypothetical protein
MITLEQLLATQSMGTMGVQKICSNVNMYDANEDPISAIIVNAYKKNQTDEEAILLDIGYAISELQKAKVLLENVIKTNNPSI